jgi:hypothetical protein
MLTHASDLVDCCQEETLNEIQVRYLEFNKHAQSYTWKVRCSHIFEVIFHCSLLVEGIKSMYIH